MTIHSTCIHGMSAPVAHEGCITLAHGVTRRARMARYTKTCLHRTSTAVSYLSPSRSVGRSVDSHPLRRSLPFRSISGVTRTRHRPFPRTTNPACLFPSRKNIRDVIRSQQHVGCLKRLWQQAIAARSGLLTLISNVDWRVARFFASSSFILSRLRWHPCL